MPFKIDPNSASLAQTHSSATCPTIDPYMALAQEIVDIDLILMTTAAIFQATFQTLEKEGQLSEIKQQEIMTKYASQMSMHLKNDAANKICKILKSALSIMSECDLQKIVNTLTSKYNSSETNGRQKESEDPAAKVTNQFYSLIQQISFQDEIQSVHSALSLVAVEYIKNNQVIQAVYNQIKC